MMFQEQEQKKMCQSGHQPIGATSPINYPIGTKNVTATAHITSNMNGVHMYVFTAASHHNLNNNDNLNGPNSLPHSHWEEAQPSARVLIRSIQKDYIVLIKDDSDDLGD